jgi:hypothetical protein
MKIIKEHKIILKTKIKIYLINQINKIPTNKFNIQIVIKIMMNKNN